MAEENTNQLIKTTKQEVAAAIGNSTIADSILASFNKLVNQDQLRFPKGYALGNQLKLMYLTLTQNSVIGKATPQSIGEALSEATLQGLEVDKKQCYFIVYGNKLTMFRSYYGDIAVAKRTGLVKDIRARVIYEGEPYELTTNDDGEVEVIGHKAILESFDKKIIGAYAWAELPNGKRQYTIMTQKEIQSNWNKSKNPTGGVQKEFPQEMSKRTVIRRLVKMIFNTAPTLTTEANAIIASYNRTTEDEYENSKPNYGNTKNAVHNQIDIEEVEANAIPEEPIVEEPIPEPAAEEKKEKDMYIGVDGQPKLF